MESHRHQESEPVPDLLDDIATDHLLLFGKPAFEAHKPLQQVAQVDTGQLSDMLSIDLKVSRFFLDPVAFTIRALRNSHKTLRPLADLLTGRGLIPALEHIDDPLPVQPDVQAGDRQEQAGRQLVQAAPWGSNQVLKWYPDCLR